MLAATVLSVVFATRGAMATNRPIVEVLHFIGAEERLHRQAVPAPFSGPRPRRRADRRGRLRCWLFGIAGIAGEYGRRHGRRRSARGAVRHIFVGIGGYIAIVVQIVLMAVVTAIASRRTVNRTLEIVE